MNRATDAALADVGLSWQQPGQAALAGPLLNLARNCDRAFLLLAAAWDASEEWHPPVLSARDAHRAGYLSSFPHQAVLATVLGPGEDSLKTFLAGNGTDEEGRVTGAVLAPADRVLTPAACYHLFAGHEGERLAAPLYLTTRNTCFRSEEHYVPLRRMSSFTMREIVCIGTARETTAFLDTARGALDRLCALVDLPVRWRRATDPFFRDRDPRGLMQRIQPLKREAVYAAAAREADPAGTADAADAVQAADAADTADTADTAHAAESADLALASLNRHQDHFGTAFGLTRDGRPAHSACLAFGVERWLFALTDRHGTDPRSWPRMTKAAEQVLAHVRGGAA